MKKPATFLVFLLVSGLPCGAEEPPSGTVDERLEALEKENRDLRDRLDRVERSEGEGRGEGPASIERPSPESTMLEDDLAVLAETGLGLNLVFRNGQTRGTLQLFGDVGAGYNDPAPDGRGEFSFFNGSLDLFFTARVGDHFLVLSETVFQTRVGDSATADSSKFDQERLWGAWAFSDALQIKLGLEHAPISLWSRSFHHGRWLELTVSRPLLANFESVEGILPMHEAGVELFGRVALTRGSLSWMVFVSNGRGDDPTVVQEFSDANNDKAVTLGGGYHFDTAATVFVGLFVRTDEIPADPVDPARARPIREWILSLQCQYQSDKFDILSEWVYMHHDERTTDTSNEHWTGYLQVGYRLNDRWTPYIRADFREMALGSPFFSPWARDLDVWELVFGTRWDVRNNAALKFEMGVGEREERSGGGAVDEGGYIRVGIQLAFVF